MMPNHVHGTIVLSEDCSVALVEVVRAFKAACSTLIRKAGLRDFGWQRGYYDRIIRNDRELDAIRRYVAGNVTQWSLDQENPDRQV